MVTSACGAVGPARRRGLADEVADRIREMIFRGTFAPGAALREVELAAALEVSRGPVRDALRVLGTEGLVHSTWHRGTTVTTLADDDVLEIDSLRGALEDLAVRRVVATASADHLAGLAAAARSMARATDVHEMVGLDVVFHDAVFAATGHGRLAESWNSLRCQVHLLLLTRVNASTEGYLTSVPREHARLVNALTARDEPAALRLFATHRRRAVDVALGD